MQTLNLKVDDSIFDYVKTMLEGFIKERKIEIIEDNNLENSCPESLIVSSVEEVRRRVFAAEKKIEENGGISEAEYEKRMTKFFKEELGIDR